MKWTSYDVMNWCIENNMYTHGDCRAYDRMLDFVRNNDPTEKTVELVAIDIISHSSIYSIFRDGDIDYIANELWNKVVK